MLALVPGRYRLAARNSQVLSDCSSSSAVTYCGLPRRGRAPCFRLGRWLLLIGLRFYLQAARSQQLAHIEQYNQPSTNLSQPGNAVQATVLKDRWRSLHRVGGNFKNLRSRIDNQPGQPARMLDHENAVLLGEISMLLSEALA